MIIRMVVVLPAPLPPTKPVMRPPGTVKLTSSTALRSPKERVSPSTSMSASCRLSVMPPR